MTRQKLILRVLLASLAVAAIAGAAGVLLGGDWLVIRITLTAVTTAAAAGLILPLAYMMDYKTLRPMAAVGVWCVVIEYVLVLAAIYISNRQTEALVWAFPGPAVGLTLAVALLAHPNNRAAAWTGICLSPATLLLLVTAVFTPRNHVWYESAGAVGGFGLLAVICLIGFNWQRQTAWKTIGVAIAAIGTVIALLNLWGHRIVDSEIVGLCAFTAAGFAHANLVLFARLKPGQLWLRYITLITAAICVLCIDYMFLIDQEVKPLLRIAGATAIFAGCGSIALLVLARLNRGINVEPGSSTDFIDITLICPRCKKKQTLPLGSAHCAACDLRIQIRVEEPRCPQCGYLLYMLKSNACPECGTAIAQTP